MSTTTSGKHGVPDRPARPLVYLDSCVFLDLVTKNRVLHPDTGEQRWRSAVALLDAVNADLVLLASSPLVEAEVTSNVLTTAAAEDIRQQLHGWFSAPSTVWTDVDRYLGRRAADVRAASRGKVSGNKMGAADAIHLAAAIRLGATHLMTQDEGFPLGHTIDGVEVMRPTVVWQEPLPLTSP